MKTVMGTRILGGRPFGGTGFVWNKSLSSSVKPRGDLRHDRITVLQVSSNVGDVLIINCYMPYYKSSDIETQSDLYMETLVAIESIMDKNPNAKFILMGDMNCNYYLNNNNFSAMLRDFVTSRKLCCTFELMDSFDPNTSFTRCDLKRNSFSLLDYFFVSSELLPLITDISVLNDAGNLSDHLPIKLSINLDVELTSNVPRVLPSIVDWRKIDDLTRNDYENVLTDCLSDLNVPDFILHGKHVCNESSHLSAIEKYYTDLINCVKIADLQLPRCTPTTRKGFWNDQLSLLKNDSMVTHEYWKLSNCPKTGPIFEAKKTAHYKYKAYLRQCKRTNDQGRIDNLNNDLLNRDHHKFWKSYKFFHYSKSGNSARVNGLIDDRDIADSFADSFRDVYETRDTERATLLGTKFRSMYRSYADAHADDSLESVYLSWRDMLDVMSKLKTGKASASFLKAEHLLYGPPQLVHHIHLLFNAMIQHCYVPCEFLGGVITPLVKDSDGDHSDPSNYRGLTLGVTFSFLFEHALMIKVGRFLSTDSLQFGYKKRHSTSHAIYTLRTCIDFFTERGSNVFAGFLDCTKGFDKVDHSGIFVKLMNRGIPFCVLNLLIYWYSNLTSMVKWNGVTSYSFDVRSGVRQGGVLSPHLFAIYIDDLIVELRNLEVGCHILDLFVAAIVYADDICLLAPSRSALQTLLDKCESYGLSWCLSYNPRKSKVMIFGKKCQTVPLRMYNNDLEVVNEYKYLGVTVVAGSNFSTSNFQPLLKFRCAANTILGANNRSSDAVLMKLLYATCVPNLTYACESVCYKTRQIEPMTVALNDSIRKIFTYNRWESVRFLRLSHGYDSITEIFAQRSKEFLRNIPSVRNPTLSHLIALN